MNVRYSAKRFVPAVLLAAWFPASDSQAQEPKAGRGPPQVVSPEVSGDGRIALRLFAPRASGVRLQASDIPGVGRGLDLKKRDDGVWEISLDPVGPGAYRYKFEVDGVAVVDPRNPSTSESQSTSWSLVHVPGSDFMDTKDVPRGAVAEITYLSKALQTFRRMHIYTPPGYPTDARTYPTFYLLHGASDSDDSWSSVGRAGFIMDNLIASGKAKPMVVVMPAGHTPRPSGDSSQRPTDRRSDAFLQEFVTDILPYVEQNYRVHRERKHRAIAGLSMGGGQTLNILIRNVDMFAYAGVFSSGVFGITGRRRDGSPDTSRGPPWEEEHKQALDGATLKGGLDLLWLATGKEDLLLETSRRTVEMLGSHGLDPIYTETAGGHTWIVWRDYLRDYAQLIFDPDAIARLKATASARKKEPEAATQAGAGAEAAGTGARGRVRL